MKMTEAELQAALAAVEALLSCVQHKYAPVLVEEAWRLKARLRKALAAQPR